MNKSRRKAIAAIREQLEAIDHESIKAALDDLREEEQEYYDNMPEGLQAGEKGQNAEAAVSCLESASDYLDNIAEAIGQLEEAEGC